MYTCSWLLEVLASMADLTPSKRRKTAEFEDVSSVCSAEAIDKASIHGVVARLSPMKQGKKTRYYEGSLTDGKKHVRIIGFSELQQKQLAKFKESADAVNIVNCEVKKAWGQTDKMEVVLKHFTDIEDSCKKFEVDTSVQNTSIDAIDKMDDLETVTVSGKVVGMEVSMQVGDGLTKQDVYISDATGTVKLTLWEGDVGKLVEGSSYFFTDVKVRSYNGKKYLSFSSGAVVGEVNNVGEVKQLAVHVKEEEVCVVIGVDNFDVCCACLSCKQKVKASGDECFGTCTRCGMFQRLDESKMHIAAKLMIKSEDRQFTLMQAYGSTVTDIAEMDAKKVSREVLLDAKPFILTYKANTIINVSRE